MKPFNLEEAKAGKKVVTRDGREYKFGAYNPDAVEYCRLIGWLDGIPIDHYEGGRYSCNVGESNNDLFMAEEEVWANVYEGRNEYYLACLSDSEMECKHNAHQYDNYIKTIRLKP